MSNNEDRAKAFVAACAERDQRWHELQKAQRLYEEAFSRACELELMCFEPSVITAVRPHGSVTAQVLALFEKPTKVRAAVRSSGFTRQQIQTVITRMVAAKRLHKQARGVYVTVKKEAK